MVKQAPVGNNRTKPHYLGHRERLHERLLSAGPAALADYELLEFLLFAARPRGDIKPLAKALLARFGSLAGGQGSTDDRVRPRRGRRRRGCWQRAPRRCVLSTPR